VSAPLFSVVVPAYNQHKFINPCLTSLQQQTVTDFEVIVVNDCSTDDTGDQIAALIKGDARFHVITFDRNRGVSAARNAGMAAAKGKYLCFVDGDDWIEPNFLSAFLSAYQAAPKSQLVICGHFGYLAVPSPAKTYDQKDLVTNINFGTVGGFSWNKCFIRSIITTHHLTFNEEISFLEDQLFAFRYADYVQSAELLTDKTYHYRWRFRSNLSHIGIPFFAARRKMMKILKQESKHTLSEDLNNQ